MENDKLVKVVACYLMQGGEIIDFWLNKYFENGDSTDQIFTCQTLMTKEILRCISQGAIFRVEIFEA